MNQQEMLNNVTKDCIERIGAVSKQLTDDRERQLHISYTICIRMLSGLIYVFTGGDATKINLAIEHVQKTLKADICTRKISNDKSVD